MICTACGHQNDAGSNFCSSCGAAIPQDVDDTTVNLPVLDPDGEPGGPALDELSAGTGMLVVRRGPNAGSKYLLDTDATTAGRHPDSNIFLDDITVSRRHATFVHTGDGYEVRDAGSLNGTYVNRERVDAAPLHSGDEVQIGRFALAFYVGEE